MKKVILCVLDGMGIRKEMEGNAFRLANTPTIDYLWENYPHSMLQASGEDVGLPIGQMGNSEVGHMNIGAGRVIYQDLIRINKSILDGSFFQNTALKNCILHCKENGTNLHIYGLLSDGGIHSHINHLFAILDFCKQENFDRVYIHVFLDGRDTEPMVGPKYVRMLQEKLDELQFGKIVTIMGRYYAMNRDRNWELTKEAYEAIIDGHGIHTVSSVEEAFEVEYQEGVTDEFMKPTVIDSVPIQDGDSILTYNYRSDRMIQMMRAIHDASFHEFSRSRTVNVHFTTMTQYEEQSYKPDIEIMFGPEHFHNVLAQYVGIHGKKVMKITEFEKNQHVTFFFNGCNDEVFENEDRIIFDRPDVFTYDELPEMRSSDITNAIIDASKKHYDLIVVNYPNGDAVGHSGKLDAAIMAVEALDRCIQKLLQEVSLDEYDIILTADHGNCEYMIDENGEEDKKHTTNPVPFIIVNRDYTLKDGRLADIAPTILTMMGLSIPDEMTGEVLIK